MARLRQAQMAQQNHQDNTVSPEVISELITSLDAGQLSKTQQLKLSSLLKNTPESLLVLTTTYQESFSGPLPAPEALAKYDESTRSIILDMALKEQEHSHKMEYKALDGAIKKDRFGQYIGGSIAISGLLAAAWISQYSAMAAGIIATLDLFGIVALFVAPRLFAAAKTKRS